MKKLMVSMFLVLATNAHAAWQFDGSWMGYGFTVREYKQNQVDLIWHDGTKGFVAYYNPNPIPRPRCLCQTYETVDGRQFLVERNGFNGDAPSGGFYRGRAFRIHGVPFEF